MWQEGRRQDRHWGSEANCCAMASSGTSSRAHNGADTEANSMEQQKDDEAEQRGAQGSGRGVKRTLRGKVAQSG